MARLVKFGNTLLPPSFAPESESLARTVEPTKLLRTDGARAIQGYESEKVIPVRGALIDGPVPNLHGQSTLRAALDALKANLAEGPASLYFWDDRYYRNVQARGMSVSFTERRYDKIAFVEVEFVAADPFQYALVETSDTWTPVTGSRNLTPVGNAFVLPTFTIRTGSTTIDWRITNSTTGEYFTLAGSGLTVGDDIVVNCLEQEVTISGVDRMSLFDGLFPRLNAGTNSITTTQTIGTISQIVTSWRDRWRG